MKLGIESIQIKSPLKLGTGSSSFFIGRSDGTDEPMKTR